MNPFVAIPANVRKWLYLAYGTVSLALAAVTTYNAALRQDSPDWITGAAAVLVVIGTALGFTAASNITPATAVLDAKSPTGESAGSESDLPTGTPVDVTPAAESGLT